MSRFVYKEDYVKSSISRLEQAYNALSQTEASLNNAFNRLSQVNGTQFIDYGKNKDIICKFPEEGRTYINELKNAVEGKCAEIQDYNNAPFWKKIFAGAGMRIAKFGEGFLAGFENMLDAGVGLFGWTAGIFNPDFKEACGEFIKKDLAGSLVSNVYKEGTFIGKYSDIGANSFRANLYKGFGTAAAYVVMGKVAGKLNVSVDKMFKANLRVSETGINSLIAGVGGMGSGTETALLKGKSFDEALFQGVKTGAIQGSIAYAIGQIGDKRAKDKFDSLKNERTDLMNQREKLINKKNLTPDQKVELESIENQLRDVNGKILSYENRFESMENGYKGRETTQTKSSNGNTVKASKIKGGTNNNGSDKIDDLLDLADDKIDDIDAKKLLGEATKSGDSPMESLEKITENQRNNGNIKFENGELRFTDKGGRQVSKSSKYANELIESEAKQNTINVALDTGLEKAASDMPKVMTKTAETTAIRNLTNPNTYTSTLSNVAKSFSTNSGALIGASETVMASRNTVANSQARASYNASINNTPLNSIQTTINSNSSSGNINGSSRGAGSEISKNIQKIASPSGKASTVNNVAEVARDTAKAAEQISNANNAIKNATKTENVQTGKGMSFNTTPSTYTSSTPTSSTSSLATSIGTIKATNTKPATTAATSTAATAATIKEAAEVATAVAQSPLSPYQSPTSTQVIAGGSKYPVNRPQIEGSLAQNNVSTTTLGSSGSTHGGGGYSNSGFSLSGSSAVTSDGSIGEQDTKGTLASSITKNNSSKTETIRLSENEEEIDEEQKANNFVIPTSAALSAAAAAGIGAKIVMDKRDKDKEEEKEQEESDDDFEVISSDFENDFESDYDDTDNEYEVVENY